MTLGWAVIIVVAFSFLVIGLDEFVAKPLRRRRLGQRKPTEGKGS